MALTSGSLLALLVVLTVLLPLGTLALWSRVRGPAAVRVLARLGMVVACQVVAVVLIAVQANDYGYFYGSWTDLGQGLAALVNGTPAARTVVTQAGVTGTAKDAAVGSLRVTGVSRFSSRAQWPVRGRLETVLIHGPTSQLSTQAYVYLPPQYFRARYARASFPAAEVFSGYPGTNRVLVARLRYQAVMLHDLIRHEARPMVLVMMRPSVTYPRDTECTDVPAGPQALTFFAQDVPMAVSRAYRVMPAGWGAIGDSTGGYCSTKITMLYPAVFRAAASLSGYYNTLMDSTTGNLWGGSQVVRNLNDLEWRLRHMPAPPVSILATSSRDERGPEGISDLRRFLRLARLPMQVDTIIEPHGGHNFQTWAPEVPRALAWLSHHLPPVEHA